MTRDFFDRRSLAQLTALRTVILVEDVMPHAQYVLFSELIDGVLKPFSRLKAWSDFLDDWHTTYAAKGLRRDALLVHVYEPGLRTNPVPSNTGSLVWKYVVAAPELGDWDCDRLFVGRKTGVKSHSGAEGN
jgi:hypothetical protein